MARRRTTFGKLQRDRDKQAKQQAKVERRQARAQEESEEPATPETPAEATDHADVLAALAELQEAFGSGALTIEEFEARRDELRRALPID
ncbi:MAG: hypothetical protein ACRD29_16050 [Acidimicrobiales bacterium]